MAVDIKSGTFWASKFDDTGNPVEFVVDLGRRMQLRSAELAWEFPGGDKSEAMELAPLVEEIRSHWHRLEGEEASAQRAPNYLLSGSTGERFGGSTVRRVVVSTV